LPMVESLAASDTKNAQAKNDLVVAYWRLGDLLHDVDPKTSVKELEKSLLILESLLKSDPQNTLTLRSKTLTYVRLASPLRKLNDREKAQQGLLKALDIQKAIIQSDPAHTQVHQDMIITYNEIGDLLLENGEPSKALENYREALQIAEPMLAKASNLYAIRDLADCYERFGNYYVTLASQTNQTVAARTENWHEGRAWYQKSLELWDSWANNNVSGPYNVKRREEALRAIGQCNSALLNLSNSKTHN